MNAINLDDKFAAFTDHWSPRTVAQFNDCQVRVSKFKGEFVWHAHADTDEMFLVHRGRLVIHLRDGAVSLGPGEIYVVPRGVEHKPVTEDECQVMVIHAEATVNTGDAAGPLTVTDKQWL